MSVFQSIPKEDIIYSGEYFFMIYDRYPVSPGHLLIISIDSSKIDFFDLLNKEKKELLDLKDYGIEHFLKV
jgi:diadenosine tetraphosphate (Ap4A) HIT family hydrolase